jgi:MoxR-like ATPase
MPPDTLFAFQAALEDNGHLNLMDHPDPKDRMLTLHEDCCTIWTSNTKGKGENSHQFAATGVMDESTRNRFQVWIQFDYMSSKQESGIIQREYPEITPYLADKMAQFAASLRNAYDTGSITSSFSLRNMLPWARYAVIQQNPAKALHSTWLHALNDDEIAAVKQIWTDVDFDDFKL